MTISNAAARDRLYFQHQRELLASTHQAWAAATGLSEELRRRLDDLDELAESIDIEKSGDNIRHRYTGSALCWMQQRMGEHVRAVRVAADRLWVAADDLREAAQDAGGMPRLEHVARGHLALVAEARRVVACHRPGAELAQVDWVRVDAIVAGIRRLEELDATELREDLAADLRDYSQRLTDLKKKGFSKIACRLDVDPRLQRATQIMRRFCSAERRRQDVPGCSGE